MQTLERVSTMSYVRDVAKNPTFSINYWDDDFTSSMKYTVILVPQEEENLVDQCRREDPNRVANIEAEVKASKHLYEKYLSPIPKK